MKAIGHTEVAEVVARLRAFQEQVANAPPDHDLKDPRLPLVAVHRDLTHTKCNIPELVPELVAALSRIYHVPREYEVIKRRYGLDGSRIYTLEDIGMYYRGLTRERVRQLENNAKKRLASALIGEFNNAIFKVPECLREEVREIRELFNTLPTLVLESEISSALERRYGAALSAQVRASIPLLLEVIGGFSIRTELIGLRDKLDNVWCFDRNIDLKGIAPLIRATRLLLEQADTPQSLFYLTSSLNRRRTKRVAAEEVRSWIVLMKDVEEINPDEFQIKFEFVNSLADKAHRILSSENHPLHYNEIARRINQRAITAGQKPLLKLHQSLRSQLSADHRFEAIGRSGYWKLRTWSHVRTDSIVDLIQEALVSKPEAASYDQIYEYVQQYRPNVLRTSIITLAQMRGDLFRRVAPGKIELVASGSKSKQEIASQEIASRRSGSEVERQMKEVILSLVDENGTSTFPLAEVVGEIRSRTGLPDSTVRSRMAKLSWARISGPKTHRTIEVNVDRAEHDKDAPERRSRVEESLESLVREFLAKQPGGRAAAVDVWNYIKRRGRFKRPTLYKVLGQMPGLIKDYEGRHLFCCLEGFADDEPLPLPGIEDVSDAHLRAELVRAQSYLTPRSIDTGLFELGKALESRLKSFLKKAQELGTYTVSKRDLSSLNDMISWLVKNNLVRPQDADYLGVLRHQRNQRAHEANLDEHQRRELWAQARFYVPSYMKYILLIHEKEKNL